MKIQLLESSLKITTNRPSLTLRVRFYKRQFRRGQALQLDRLQSNNPQQFWKEINKLGSKKLKKIPVEILLDNGDTENKKELVLEIWKTDFANTFSGHLIPPGFDDLLLMFVIQNV